MKGEKVVDGLQILSDSPLFLNVRKGYRSVSYEFFIQVVDRTSCGKHPILIKHLIRSEHMAKELQIKPILSIPDKKPTIMNTAIYPHNIRLSEAHGVGKNQIPRLYLPRFREAFRLDFFSGFGDISSLRRGISNLYPVQAIRRISDVIIYRSRRTTTLNQHQIRELTLFPIEISDV